MQYINNVLEYIYIYDTLTRLPVGEGLRAHDVCDYRNIHPGNTCTFPGFIKYVPVQIQHNKQSIYIVSKHMLHMVNLFKSFKFMQYLKSLM